MDGREAGSRPDDSSRRRVLAAAGTLGAGLIAGCTGGGSSGGDGGSSSESTADEAETAWRRTELTDVLTDETFTIDGLAGPVAVQSFAVWCPKCQRQSETLSQLGDSVTVVGLNTDPNEDAAKVRRHAEQNGFDWRFAVAPSSMTDSLIERFGTTVTNAPSTPIVVACDDGVASFFAGSQQSADEIRSAADEC